MDVAEQGKARVISCKINYKAYLLDVNLPKERNVSYEIDTAEIFI